MSDMPEKATIVIVDGGNYDFNAFSDEAKNLTRGIADLNASITMMENLIGASKFASEVKVLDLKKILPEELPTDVGSAADDAH
jgi:hypothetical protein